MKLITSIVTDAHTHSDNWENVVLPPSEPPINPSIPPSEFITPISQQDQLWDTGKDTITQYNRNEMDG